jgi:hypothetical protein
MSTNLHRRHLTTEQKRTIVATVLKAQPAKSDRQVAKSVGVSPSTVGSERKKQEQAGDVSKLDTRTDTKGREQPATKPPKWSGAEIALDQDIAQIEQRARRERLRDPSTGRPELTAVGGKATARQADDVVRSLDRATRELRDLIEGGELLGRSELLVPIVKANGRFAQALAKAKDVAR